MITDKVKDIILMLVKSTENGDLIWHAKAKGDFNNEMLLTSKSEDELTTFEITVKYVLSGDIWVLETSTGLWIKNNTLPNNGMYLTSTANPDIITLRNFLSKGLNLSPSSEIVEDKLADICKSISKSTYRDNIITRIFNGNGKN
jgi:hypothetical protein